MLLTKPQMNAALISASDVPGRGWKKDRSPSTTTSSQWRPKRCNARLGTFARTYLVDAKANSSAHVTYERGEDFNQQSFGETVVRQEAPVDIDDIEGQIADLIDACPQMSSVPDKSSNSIELPAVMQFSPLDVAQLGDGSTGLRMLLNAIFVSYYVDIAFTAVDNYLIAVSSTAITPRHKALTAIGRDAVQRLETALDSVATAAPQTTVPQPSASGDSN